MYGMQNARKAWRFDRLASSACLRSVAEEAFYHQLGIELSPSVGGPPG